MGDAVARPSAFIDVEQVSKRYRNQRVLSNVTLRLGPGQKGALAGSNGVGKSTLLRLIAGLERPNAGSVNLPSAALIGYLEQEVEIEGHETIDAYLRRAAGIDRLQRRMDELAADLASSQRLDEYAELQTEFECIGGWDFDRRLDIVLAGLGLHDVAAGRALESLSGGQRSKVALAGILLKGVDVLLLDEPTNNLDLPGLVWLENFLIQSPATILMVSHDRRLMDRVVSKVFEIDWQTREATTYGGGYSDFLDLKSQELRRQKELFRQQREEIARLRQSIRQHNEWAAIGAKQEVADRDKVSRDFSRDRSANLARRGKSIAKRLEQMELVDVPNERPPLNLRMEPNTPSPAAAGEGRGEGTSILQVEAAHIGYPRGFAFGPVAVRIQEGERTAILGPNGAGKSTLLKTLTGSLRPLSGSVMHAPGLVIGNLMQAHEDLPRAATPLHHFQAATGLDEPAAAELLRDFQLLSMDLRKPIRQLNPGARTRLLLAQFAAQQANLLVLDEPTNHLDLEAIEALEDALATYAGAIIVVSHDRQFLSQLDLSHTFLLQDGALQAMPDISAYAAAADVRAKKLLTRL